MKLKLTYLFILCRLTLFGQDKIYFSQPYTIIENEILVPVNLNENDITIFQKLTELVDSTIFYDEFGDSRKRLDYDIGIKYFDIPQKQNLIIYDRLNKPISSARFVRFEYYENMIESQFIATYSIENKKIEFEKIGFCINENAKELIENQILIKREKPIDTERTKKIKDKFYIYHEDYLTYQNNNNTEKYHLISYEDTNGKNTENSFVSQIYCTQNNQERLIIELIETFVLKNLIVTSLLINQKPIILCKIGIPDTDFEDFVTLVHDKEKYRIGNKSIEYE